MCFVLHCIVCVCVWDVVQFSRDIIIIITIALYFQQAKDCSSKAYSGAQLDGLLL